MATLNVAEMQQELDDVLACMVHHLTDKAEQFEGCCRRLDGILNAAAERQVLIPFIEVLFAFHLDMLEGIFRNVLLESDAASAPRS